MLRTGATPVVTAKPATEVPAQLQFKSLTKGSGPTQLATGEAGSAVLSGGTPLGRKIAETALKYRGVKYVWGGTTPNGWDCSGMVYYILNQCGVKVGRLQSTMYMVWPGAVAVKRAECAAGDLCVWVGHIGIAISNSEMVHAPTFGKPTQIAKIDGAKTGQTVTIRRVKG
jgi:cell wall-associated NlpC family hydrolase